MIPGRQAGKPTLGINYRGEDRGISQRIIELVN